MAIVFDTARPRFFAIDADYRIEVTRSHDGVTAPLDVVDVDGESCDADDLLALARDLCSYEGEDVEEALDALLGYALELDAAERNVAIADECDIDAAIPYTLAPSEEPIAFALTDAASAALDELVEWAPDEDPERPEPWRMDDDGVNAFAAQPLWRGPCAECGLRGTSMMSATCPRCSHPTGRALRSLDRAAGAR
jgi:hypothetical protein